MTTLSSLVAPWKKFPAEQVQNGVILDYQTPQVASGSVDPDTNGGLSVIACAAGGLGGWVQEANGYIYNSTSYANIFSDTAATAPAINGTARVYEVTGKFDATPGTNEGLHIIFNHVDTNNFWLFRFQWNGSAWHTELWEKNASSWYSRDNYASWGAMSLPLFFHHRVYDSGDYLRVVSSCFDVNGGPQGDDTLYYYAASRPHKGNTSFIFQTYQACPEIKIRSARIFDV